MDPVYTPPVGLEGYVTRPLSEIELPSDSNGHFEWQTEMCIRDSSGTCASACLVGDWTLSEEMLSKKVGSRYICKRTAISY